MYYKHNSLKIKGRIMLNSTEKKKVSKQVRKFIKIVNNFLSTKGGGTFPKEWTLSRDLLETYYHQFLTACAEIEQLGCLYIETNRGSQKEHPLLSIRDKAAIRIEGLMKQMGLTMKSGLQLGTTDVQKAETPLDLFFKEAGRDE